MIQSFKVRVGVMAGPGIAQGYNLVDYVETRFDGTAERRFGIFRDRYPYQIEVEPGIKLDYSPRRGDSGDIESIDCIVLGEAEWLKTRRRLLALGWTSK